MKITYLKCVIMMLILTAAAACSSTSSTPDSEETTSEATFPTDCAEVDGTATFSDVYAIMNQTSGKGCVNSSCHGGTRTPALGESEDTAKANIVGVASLDGTRTYITANSLDSTQSFLYNKLTDPVSGVQMPSGGTEWDSDDILIIAGWICAGAN